MIIKVAGQEYFVTNCKKQIKSQSVGSLSDLNNTNSTISSIQEQSVNHDERVPCRYNEDSRRDSISKNKKLNCDTRERNSSNRRNSKRSDVVGGCDTKHIHGNRNISEDVRKRSGSNRSNSSIKTFQNKKTSDTTNEKKQPESTKSHSYTLSKSKSEGNPFQHRKQGKIIKISQRPVSTGKFCMKNKCVMTAVFMTLHCVYIYTSRFIRTVSYFCRFICIFLIFFRKISMQLDETLLKVTSWHFLFIIC